MAEHADKSIPFPIRLKPGPLIPAALVCGGAAALVLAAVLAAATQGGMKYFLHSYLLNFCFFLSISLGAIFFVAVTYACAAGWCATVRRIAEIMATGSAAMAVLSLPIIIAVFAGDILYPWRGPGLFEAPAGDTILAAKLPYLNAPFFVARLAVYFAVWIGVSFYYYRQSVAQDETGNPDYTRRMQRISPIALILFAFTTAFAAFDLLMSLDPHWFSTMFGVYYFSGAVVGFLAAHCLALVLLRRRDDVAEAVSLEHLHELSKLMFAFVVFWGYIAFSQYMLIWYGNIPEETIWYQARQEGGWLGVSVLLLAAHLIVPFLGLMSRNVKRNAALVAAWCVWLLAAHWLDMYYLVMPTLKGAGPAPGVLDLLCLLGIGGVYLGGVALLAGENSLVAIHDPRTAESLAFHTH